MFQSLLIANRGEIACRVIRACEALGIEPITIFSGVDTGALHTTLAPKSHNIGDSPDSYLDSEKLVQIALETGAEALHPGYGFLAENGDFVDKCNGAGIKFVGPASDIIRMMGDKSAARAIAAKAKVPIVPGSDLIDDIDAAQRIADEHIGYPLMVKASGGGGGIGIIPVEKSADLADAIERAGLIGKKSFGSGGVYLERMLVDVAHIEVQVVGDQHGNAVHLFERNCSVQRRNQKLVEETPATFLSPDQREQICASAVQLARYVKYDSVGTVEFLFDRQTQQFYFMEMNTRIQVEHPITEMVTGIDLVETQIRVAAGEKLPEMGLEQSRIKHKGAAIEARVLAEDAATQTPSPGLIELYEEPLGDDLRIDSGFTAGKTVTAYYDSLLAKVISHKTEREQARQHLVRALRLFKIGGISTNIVALLSILEDSAFKSGDYNTHILPNMAREHAGNGLSSADIAALTVMLHFGRQQPVALLPPKDGADANQPSRWWRNGQKRQLRRRKW